MDANIEHLKLVENIIILGCGTSYYAGMTGKAYFKSMCAFNTVQVFDGMNSMFQIYHQKVKVLYCLFHNQRTKDLYRCIDTIKNSPMSPITIGIINMVDSLIAREVSAAAIFISEKNEA